MPLNYNTLNPLTVELAVRGINENKDPSAQHDFDFELSMRPHISQKTVTQDRLEPQFNIRLIREGIDSQTTAGNMAEEIFEIVTGLLNEVEGVHVIVLKVEEIK